MELNKIYNIDCIEGLKQLEDNSIDLIITSPPYNKMGLNGFQKGKKWHGTIIYDNDVNSDNMNEEDYQNWQIEFLTECFRVLKKDGSMFYNHKNRIHKGTIISPYKWLFKTPFLIRQEIIWDRGSTHNVNRCRFLPTTELIFWLTKSSSPRFDRTLDTPFKNEIWSFPFQINTEHPAPFPLELPDNIIHCVAKGETITVLDPFMGGGTTAIAAIKHNCNYVGFEKAENYCNLSQKNIENYIKERGS